MRKVIDFTDAVLILREQYEKAKQLLYVRKPLAFALYQTWKIVDKKEKVRNIRALKGEKP